MKIPIYQLDAFAERQFAGNPAAVCLLDDWLDDAVMQSIAIENNLSETAFVIAEGDHYHIRWFTPAYEVDLCGHATLVAAAVVSRYVDSSCDKVRFQSRSGPLSVGVKGEELTLDFPASRPQVIEMPDALREGLRVEPESVWRGIYFMAVYPAQQDVAAIQPDLGKLATLESDGIIVTAPGDEVDFVSRFFAPRAGIPEDPVTGSAYCVLTPYWSERLGKSRLNALQISPRGGVLYCEDHGDRVLIGGKVADYLKGEIEIPDR